MGAETSKLSIIAKVRKHKLQEINIPYSQLQMIQVLQSKFDFEVKGTIYFESENTITGSVIKFKHFTVRTDSSELYSYGDQSWKICYHTHPDATAIKYGLRYFSPPSVDDVLEMYNHSLSYVPSTIVKSLGEISIIFANEGIYLLQVDRDRFDSFNSEGLPIELLEEVLKQTFTQFMTDFLKSSFREMIGPGIELDLLAPQITIDQYYSALTALAAKVTDDFGFVMTFHSWPELEKNGLNIMAYDYFISSNTDA